MIEWSVSRVLARGPRPGFPESAVSRFEVEDWVREARSLGICTILCLLSESELGIYAAALAVVGGLLGFYRSRGLAVRHVPLEPGRDPAVNEQQLAELVAIFKASKKPVLVHAASNNARTSAAIDELERFLGG